MTSSKQSNNFELRLRWKMKKKSLKKGATNKKKVIILGISPIYFEPYQKYGRTIHLFFHVTNQPETKRWASAASLGQTLCFPKDPPAIGLTLFSSTNLSCSSHVIVLRQHGTARAPNPYEKQHPLRFNIIPEDIEI